MMDVDSTDLVTVSYADHCQYVAIALRNMFDSKRGTDFDFRLGKNSVRAHRLIVELFLTPEIIGSDQNEPPVLAQVKQEVADDGYGCGRNILDFVIEFLYKGEVAVPEQQLDDLLGIAKELNFEMLVDAVKICRPIDIFTEDDLNIQTKDDQFCPEPVIEIEESVEPRIENNQCGRDGFDAKESSEICVDHELALRPCSVNLGPRISACYQSTPTDTNGLGHPLRGIKSEDVSEISNTEQLQLQPICFKLEPDDALEDSMSRDAANSSGHLFLNSCSDGDDDGGAPGDDLFGQETSGAPPNKKSVIHKGARHYKCSHCNFETPVYQRHIAHLENIHGITDSKEQALNRKCPNCEYQTSNRYKYRNHCYSVHQITIQGEPAPMLKCPHCEFQASSPHKYRNHCLSAHQLTVRGDPALMRKCPKCDYSSIYTSMIKRHLSTVHTQERSHACLLCSYAGKLKSKLKVHIDRVHGKAGSSFMCKVCKIHCESQYELNRHFLTHTVDLPFKCPQCNYATKTKATFKRHLNLIHGKGECRFTCKTCNKRCDCRITLELHSRIHSNERPFKCPHCSFDSKHEMSLNRHVLKVHQ